MLERVASHALRRLGPAQGKWLPDVTNAFEKQKKSDIKLEILRIAASWDTPGVSLLKAAARDENEAVRKEAESLLLKVGP